jgi:uncharacterized protein
MKKSITLPFVEFSVKHPWIIILLSLLITVSFTLPLQHLQIEPDVESLLPDDLKNKTTDYDKLLIMVSGENLYTLKGLQLFEKTYQKIIDQLPVKSVIDPFSFTDLKKAGSRLTAHTLAPGGVAPKTEEDLALFKDRIKKSRFSSGLISSKDRDALVVILLVEKAGNYKNIMLELNKTVEPLKEILDVVVSGTIPFSAETEIFLSEGFSKLLILVLATILISYYIGFRSKRAVFLPITIVLSGTILSLSIMVLAGFKLTMVSIISPPLVLTLGSSYSIHVMSSYYRLAMISNDSKKDIIIKSVTNVSGTVMLASFTTLIGLLSLLMATIRQTREFAIVTSVGIIFTAILSITLLPAFLSIQPKPERKKLKTLDSDILSKFLNHFGRRIVNWKFQALTIIIIIVMVFLILLPGVSFNTTPAKYFPKSSVLMVDYFNLMEKIGGYDELKIDLKATESGVFLQPEILKQIKDLENKLLNISNISYLISFPEYLSYAGKIMTGIEGNYNSKALNRMVSRLFNSVYKENKMLNEDHSEISIYLRVFNREKNMPIDENDTKVLISDMGGVLNNYLPEELDWEIVGRSLGFLQLSEQMRRDFLVSTITALILIGIISSIAFKSILKGILTLIPLLTGIFTSLILMSLFNIPLDMTTIMVACISIGVGVDDSIHFLLQYQKQSLHAPYRSGSAVFETLKHAGRPIAITTLSIIAGLLFLSLAKFQPIRYFGLLIVFTLSTACFATLFVLPPILKAIQRTE